MIAWASEQSSDSNAVAAAFSASHISLRPLQNVVKNH